MCVFGGGGYYITVYVHQDFVRHFDNKSCFFILGLFHMMYIRSFIFLQLCKSRSALEKVQLSVHKTILQSLMHARLCQKTMQLLRSDFKV